MIKAIVTDIEGTTSSLSFVKDVLFPYARQHLAEYVHQHSDDEAVQKILADVYSEVGRELEQQQAIDQLLQWIAEDKKITPLKALQGLIWEAGYKNGDYQGHIYEDAVQKLQDWKEQDIDLYVYSSGSVYAQKLLFGYTAYGDLNPLFNGHFDTRIGAKIELGSYQAIADELQLPAKEVLFLSDIKAELDAAKGAGMQTYWLVREGVLDNNAAHPQVSDFSQIHFS